MQFSDSAVDERVADLVLQISLVVLDDSRVQVFLLQNKRNKYLDEVFDVDLSLMSTCLLASFDLFL